MLILGQDAGVAALRRIINLMIAEEQGGDVMRRAEAAPA
jgi:hypothetical protein